MHKNTCKHAPTSFLQSQTLVRDRIMMRVDLKNQAISVTMMRGMARQTQYTKLLNFCILCLGNEISKLNLVPQIYNFKELRCKTQPF